MIIRTQGDEATARKAEKELYAKAERASQQDPPKKNGGQQGAPTKRKGGSADKENREPAPKKKKASEPKAARKAPARKREKKIAATPSDKPDFELGSPAPGIVLSPTTDVPSPTNTPSPLPDADLQVADIVTLGDLTSSSSDTSLHATVDKVSTCMYACVYVCITCSLPSATFPPFTPLVSPIMCACAIAPSKFRLGCLALIETL